MHHSCVKFIENTIIPGLRASYKPGFLNHAIHAVIKKEGFIM